ISASEQCGRNRINQILAPQSLSDFLQHTQPTQGMASRFIFCDPDAEHNLDAALTDLIATSNIHLVFLIGPEGGWSETEKAQAVAAGAYPMRFGTRILRTETAAIALVSAASARLGWL